jgi:TBC1 domain family protein 5
MNKRNQQLARMLDQAMADLRAVSVSEDGDKDKYVQAMDLAIAKVDFVKIYLEDSTMPLPTETSDDLSPAATSPTVATSPKPSLLDPSPSFPPTPVPDPEKGKMAATGADLPPPSTPTPDFRPKIQEAKIEAPPAAVSPAVSEIAQDKPEADAGLLARPRAPVPTRSTIAQSSFSWMLEPDSTPPTSSGKLSPPKSSSPFLKSGKRPTAGPGREKAAFLFGDDGGETPLTNTRLASLVDADEGFKLGTIKGGKGE